jgi:hypothetical protein
MPENSIVMAKTQRFRSLKKRLNYFTKTNNIINLLYTFTSQIIII